MQHLPSPAEPNFSLIDTNFSGVGTSGDHTPASNRFTLLSPSDTLHNSLQHTSRDNWHLLDSSHNLSTQDATALFAACEVGAMLGVAGAISNIANAALACKGEPACTVATAAVGVVGNGVMGCAAAAGCEAWTQVQLALGPHDTASQEFIAMTSKMECWAAMGALTHLPSAVGNGHAAGSIVAGGMAGAVAGAVMASDAETPMAACKRGAVSGALMALPGATLSALSGPGVAAGIAGVAGGAALGCAAEVAGPVWGAVRQNGMGSLH